MCRARFGYNFSYFGCLVDCWLTVWLTDGWLMVDWWLTVKTCAGWSNDHNSSSPSAPSIANTTRMHDRTGQDKKTIFYPFSFLISDNENNIISCYGPCWKQTSARTRADYWNQHKTKNPLLKFLLYFYQKIVIGFCQLKKLPKEKWLPYAP